MPRVRHRSGMAGHTSRAGRSAAEADVCLAAPLQVRAGGIALRRGFTSSDATTGNYNQFWITDRDFDNRTSLVTDPADGRLPPMTPEAQKRRASLQVDRAQRGFNGPEDRALSERCITFGAPRLQAAYNS